MPTDNRATAERIARDICPDGAAQWVVRLATDCVLAGMAHRDRTAERIAPFTLADADRYTKRNSTTFEQDIVDAVNEDRKHRHRTVERDDITDERMRAAWDEAYRRVKPPAPKAEWPAHHPASIAWHREFIAAFHGLAAEFDAGERVIVCALCQQAGADIGTGQHLTRDECIEALGKRLAEQRGAER